MTTATINPVIPAHRSGLELLQTPVSEPMDAAELLRSTGLANWNIRKVPSFAQDLDGSWVRETGRYGVIRDSEAGVLSLGNVGEKFSITQNEDITEILDTIKDEAGGEYSGAGCLGKGHMVFVDLKLPGRLMVNGVDPVDMHLAIFDSHDGGGSLTAMTIPMRLFCANQLNVATQSAASLYRVRHTSGVKRNALKMAHEVLDESFSYLDEFSQAAEQMAATELSNARFEEIISKEFGAKKGSSQATLTRAEARLEEFMSLFAEVNTQAGIRNTVWAGFNALTEWFDHYSPTRGQTPEESRAQKALLDPTFKDGAFRLMMAQV